MRLPGYGLRLIDFTGRALAERKSVCKLVRSLNIPVSPSALIC